ncbi:class I adenylate-forming enzyme family protein [Microbulbifer sp. ANSA001]|uniref:class I adenylate-forming enzyme family protein n=1 Tax=Microbulbifer sp. ANSA001 TaxID=3243358 RepID=UPI004041DAD2
MPIFGPRLSRPVNLGDLLSLPLNSRPDTKALVSGSREWTWRGLQRDIDALAKGLITMGLHKSDRVATLMPNRGEILVFYLACLKVGLVVVPLNYRYTTLEIDYALEKSGAVALIIGAERSEDIQDSKFIGKLKKGFLYFGGVFEDTRSYEGLINAGGQPAEIPVSSISDPAFLFFTSGSTGKPKAVVHSLLSFGSIVAGFVAALKLTRDDIVLPGGSIAHVGSLSTALAALSVGAKTVIPQSFDGEEILSILRSSRPTILVMVPAVFIAMERNPGARREDFESLRVCFTGGDKFPVNIAKEFTNKTGHMIQEGYGLTEAPDCLFNQSLSPDKAGSVGTVAPGYVASLRDEKGQEVAPNVDGNLWLRGSPVMTGYWKNPQANREALSDGWFDTGDVMRVDSDGCFWFRGRKKQIIVHDGSNISPQEVEEALMEHPSVNLAGVIGIRDDTHGESVWAFITLKKNVPMPSVSEVIRFAKKRIGYKAPEVVEILADMPINPTGKIDRVALKRLAEAQLVQGKEK